MGNVYWTGNALSRPQVQTITVAGTWLSTETATMTINGKDIVVTLVGDETTAVVAVALKEAWMMDERLNGSGTTDATSNAGGYQFGEFREVEATVSGSVVTLTGKTAGIPFTVTVAETSTSGTLTLDTVQSATGQWHWNDADNWDTGVVPANDDVVIFRGNNIPVRYGLPNGSLEVTINQYHNWEGEAGLPEINKSDRLYPYPEYRQRYIRLDDSGGGSNIAHRFGIGKDGKGCTLFNLKHSTVKCSPIVYNTGDPQINDRPGTKALNICCTANTSTINILDGSVDFGSQDGGTSAFLTAVQNNGDACCIGGIHTTNGSVTCAGGMLLIGGTGAIAEIHGRGGTLRLEGQTGTITTISLLGGVVDCVSAGTITTLWVNGGTFDARNSSGFTVTNGIMYAGKFHDPYKRMTVGTSFSITFDPSPDLQFGGSVNDAIEITP